MNKLKWINLRRLCYRTNLRRTRKVLFRHVVPIFDKTVIRFGTIDTVQMEIMKHLQVKSVAAHVPRLVGCIQCSRDRNGELIVGLPAQETIPQECFQSNSIACIVDFVSEFRLQMEKS